MSSNLIQMPWKEIGTLDKTAGAADAALAVTERYYTFCNALAATNCVIVYPLPLLVDKLLFRFRGKTNGENHVADVWLGRLCEAVDTSLFRLCTLDIEIGTQVARGSPTNYTLFADELTLTNNTTSWETVATAVQSGNDTELLAQLGVVPHGCDLLIFHGHTTMTNNLKIDMTGYSLP